jgi:hypothetical protein
LLSVLQGCAEHGQLHGTTCQRMLLASLLAMTGNIMSLGKVCWHQCNTVQFFIKHFPNISNIQYFQHHDDAPAILC